MTDTQTDWIDVGDLLAVRNWTPEQLQTARSLGFPTAMVRQRRREGPGGPVVSRIAIYNKREVDSWLDRMQSIGARL